MNYEAVITALELETAKLIVAVDRMVGYEPNSSPSQTGDTAMGVRPAYREDSSLDLGAIEDDDQPE